MNKKGITVFRLFLFIFIIFFGAIFLGIALFIFNQVDSVLDQDVMVGQVNLGEINAVTFGAMNIGFINNADTIGLILLLGMSFMMILNGYFTGSRFPRAYIVVDILILVFVFITAVYVSQVYEIFINSAPLLLDVYINDLPKTSTFVLNLPEIIGTLGALIMIFSYSRIKRGDEEVRVSSF